MFYEISSLRFPGGETPRDQPGGETEWLLAISDHDCIKLLNLHDAISFLLEHRSAINRAPELRNETMSIISIDIIPFPLAGQPLCSFAATAKQIRWPEKGLTLLGSSTASNRRSAWEKRWETMWSFDLASTD